MGAVNINNTGSGASVALSSDGTSLLLNGTAIGGGSSTLVFNNQTAAYTVVSGDAGKIINCSGASSFTVSLTAAATLGSGFNCVVWNTSTTAAMAVTIDPSGAETIDGVATLVLRRGEGVQIVCNGTNWETGNKKTMRGYAENLTNTDARPTASGQNAIAIGSNAQATGTSSASFAQGAIASGNYALSLGLNALASGERSVAIGNNGVTSGSSYSTAIGHNSSFGGSTTATGSGAMALGGSYASGSNSFAAGIGNNTSSYGATGSTAVALGSQAKASGSQGVALGNQASASGANSFAVGYLATASGNAAIALSAPGIGYGCYATQDSSVAIGDGARSGIKGKYAYTAFPFAADADSQTGTFVLRRATTDATATVLTTDNTTASTTNQVILPNNSAYAFTGTVVARRQAAGGTESAAWKVEGLIRREANAGTTTLVASTVTAISNVPAWTLALTADTTNGGLAVTATGAAATNIRWVATIQTSEVTYA